MALILARLLATTTSLRLWEVRTGVLRSLLSAVSLLVSVLGLRLLSSQAARQLRGSRRIGAHWCWENRLLSWNGVLRFIYSREPGVPSTFGAASLLGLLLFQFFMRACGISAAWLLSVPYSGGSIIYLCLLIVRLHSGCRVGGRSFSSAFLAIPVGDALWDSSSSFFFSFFFATILSGPYLWNRHS